MNILKKIIFVDQQVLLFNSRLKLIARKINSRWDRLFVVTDVLPYCTFENASKATKKAFKVNGHKFKIFKENKPLEVVETS